VIYNIDGRGTMVAKITYGYFTHNPSFDIATAANPNQGAKSITYTWTDRNGDRLYQPGEEGTLVSSNLAGAVSSDPNIRQPHSHEISGFLERALGAGMAVRAGVVYKTNDDLWQAYRPFRPTSAYTLPFLAHDAGEDGVARTTDDRDLTFYGTPNAKLGAATTIIQNVPAFGRYTSVAASIDRRPRGRWSFGAGVSYSRIHEHNNNYIGNTVTPAANPGYPNSPNEMLFANGADGANRFTLWDLKAHGTWDAPLGLRVTPVLRAQAGQPYGRVLQVTAGELRLFRHRHGAGRAARHTAHGQRRGVRRPDGGHGALRRTLSRADVRGRVQRVQRARVRRHQLRDRARVCAADQRRRAAPGARRRAHDVVIAPEPAVPDTAQLLSSDGPRPAFSASSPP